MPTFTIPGSTATATAATAAAASTKKPSNRRKKPVTPEPEPESTTVSETLIVIDTIPEPEPEPEPEIDFAEWTLKNKSSYYVEEVRPGLPFTKRRVINPETDEIMGVLGDTKFAELV